MHKLSIKLLHFTTNPRERDRERVGERDRQAAAGDIEQQQRKLAKGGGRGGIAYRPWPTNMRNARFQLGKNIKQKIKFRISHEMRPAKRSEAIRVEFNR